MDTQVVKGQVAPDEFRMVLECVLENGSKMTHKPGSAKNPFRIMTQDADTDPKRHEIEQDSQNADNVGTL